MAASYYNRDASLCGLLLTGMDVAHLSNQVTVYVSAGVGLFFYCTREEIKISIQAE
jgi:hypothetical protein